jgi:hypothetical protein
MLVSFAYLAFSAVLRLLVGAGAASSAKTSSYWCCDISWPCLDGKSCALHSGRLIARSLPRLGACSRGGDVMDWW